MWFVFWTYCFFVTVVTSILNPMTSNKTSKDHRPLNKFFRYTVKIMLIKKRNGTSFNKRNFQMLGVGFLCINRRLKLSQ